MAYHNRIDKSHQGGLLSTVAKDLHTKAQILKGAKQVFSQKGFQASIKEIASAAGISTTSLIFWYFKDKESLFLEVIKSASPLAQVQEVLSTKPPHSGDVASPQAIAAVVERYFSVYADPLNRAILFQMLAHTERHAEVRALLHDQLTTVMSGQMTHIIREGQDAGQFRHDLPAEFLGQTCLGLLFALVTRWHVEGILPWSAHDVTQNLLALLTPLPECPSP